MLELIRAGPSSKQDDVYRGLIQHYSEKFLSLTPAEEASVLMKQQEYIELLKKAVQLTYILMNINPNKIKSVIFVFTTMIKNIPLLKKKYPAYA